MSKRHAYAACSLSLVFLWAGCASPGRSVGTGDSDGGPGRVDSGPPDLARGGGNNPDLANTPPPDLAQSLDATVPPDLIVAKKGVGESCGADGECAFNKCVDLYQGNKYCVAPCKAAGDCAAFMTSFCEPITAGSASGYCIPRHPAHCASCASDADCGSLSERCLVGPGDLALACHIDCAIDGAAACPNDYTCTAVTDNNVQRKLCLPNAKVCLDSVGGFCDRVGLPQSCSRTNVSGVCSGQRACLAGPKRYDKCGAMAPQYRQCNQQDPAGCTLKVDPASLNTKSNCGACGVSCAQGDDCCGGACASLSTAKNCGACGTACGQGQGCCGQACTPLSTIQNCGACGNACPGQTTTSDALCGNGQCDMTCRGDNYDVDKSPNDGCEVPDVVPPAHTQQTASDRGHKPCDDGPSTDTFGANVPSDARLHTNPAVTSFNGTVGAAPDWWQVQADGGNFCINDYSLTLTTTGGGNTACYTCTFITNKKTDSVTVNGNGTATTSGGSGSYSGGSTIYFKIEKVCNLPVVENVNYTVKYHL